MSQLAASLLATGLATCLATTAATTGAAAAPRGGKAWRTVAPARPTNSSTAPSTGPTIDWAAGQLVALGLGLADRHAPSPAVARGTARRGAEDAARAQLAALALTVPLARGGTVADRVADAAVKARLAAAVAAAIVLDAAPETDGSWRVTMALPIEAIRQALDGGRVLPPGGDDGPPVVVIEGVAARPALGYTVGATTGAVRWVATLPAFATDAPVVHATGATAGAIAGAIAVDRDGGATAATLWLVHVAPAGR